MDENGQMDTGDILQANADEKAEAERQKYILEHAPAIAAAIMSREDPPLPRRAATDAADIAMDIFNYVTGNEDF